MKGAWPPTHPLIGRVLQSRYQIASFICEGGMAQVFCSTQDEEPRHVAIKVMRPELARQKDVVGRFLREARVASRLQHPNIVRTICADEDAGYLFIVMELLFGDDLSARIKLRGSFTEERIAGIMIDVFSALAHAHEQGVVHRDIKPENVMLCRQPAAPTQEVVKVLDFGIAKILDATPTVALPDAAPTGVRSVLTHVGDWVGTPAYMSPEQGSAEPADHRADLYSAGVLLYELITGRLPFEGQTPLQIIARHVHDPVPRPSSFQQIHPGLEDLLLRLLAKRPSDRPQSAKAVVQELSFLLGDLAVESSQRWFQSIGPHRRSYPEPDALAGPRVAQAGPTGPSSSTPRPVAVEPSTPQEADGTLQSAATHDTLASPASSDDRHSAESLRALQRTMVIPVDDAEASSIDHGGVGTGAAGPTVGDGGGSPPLRRTQRTHPLLGRVLWGTYELASCIREGRVAQVFGATLVGRPGAVAVKVLHPRLSHDHEIVARFIRGAQLACRLSHPNIVRTLGANHEAGLLYIVMELLLGDDLAARAKQPGAVTQERALQIAMEVCRALAHAHAAGVVHRDIKPANIMLCRAPEAPERETVKVLDFGLARALETQETPAESSGSPRALTRSGTILGTPEYMSPEQWRGEVVDHRSDLYSLGVVLFELLLGRLPTSEETMERSPGTTRDAASLPPSLSVVPPRIARIVTRALRSDPRQRFQSAEEMLLALESAQSPSTPPSDRRPSVPAGGDPAGVAAPMQSEGTSPTQSERRPTAPAHGTAAVAKLTRLVTLLAALLAVACVAVAALLYAVAAGR